MDHLSKKRGKPVFHLGSLENWMLSRDLAMRDEKEWGAIPWMLGCQWSATANLALLLEMMPPGSPERARATHTRRDALSSTPYP
jgi:hypothetical protein